MAWYRAGGGGIPSSLKTDMNDALNKKFGTSQDYPPADWAPTVNLMGPLPEKTVSGSIVSFPDGADAVPLKKCEITLPASLDGYSSVDVVATGKNLFDKDNPNEVDGYITTTGFSTGNANAKTIYIPIKSGETYTVSKTAGQRFQIAMAEVIPSNNAVFTNRQEQSGSQAYLTITAGANDQYLWAWVFLDGTDTGTLADMLASIQIEVGSTATAYEAYTAPTTHTASLGRTIYGGTADVVAGQGTETYTKIKLSSDWPWFKSSSALNGFYASISYNSLGIKTNTAFSVSSGFDYTNNVNEYFNTYGKCYCDTSINFNCDPSICGGTTTDEWKQYITDNDIYILAQLETATDFTFDPVPIDSKLGNNTLWSEQGDTEVTYRADINLALGGQ